MNNKEKYIHLFISACFLALGVVIASKSTVSFYDLKYGRDLVFSGTSKYILALSVLSCALGFFGNFKELNRDYEILNAENPFIFSFIASFIFLLLAYAIENGTFQ
ncbi:hypothetical protein [Pseudoteredinibacter isoporae]|uniref:Uncharacterized protein n=1 Tax=Pseudoteredinibacter isoporae TaxID=570281 RepID=A0A7X0MXC4_9GAMM|nr:hypothetical protein [Pseudoteredinibacter isoporae]MBB6520757.1 hypothetical protein [Pseudoteredinibacter isoporae]NIB25225.1 hypothetical protein [Pseudoteredinibacter isoporae]